MIKKILVANRGEIAIRVFKTAKKMGIATVAVFSEADRNSLFVKEADEAVCIGGNQPNESYLVHDKIIDAAKRTSADAIHPGYGFLSENESFAKRCREENIIFIGPSPEAIYAMGDKKRAKEIVAKHNVPVIPGYNGEDQKNETLAKKAKEIGFPVLLKASAGGGGKGMRIVREEKNLTKEIEAAKRESLSAFADDTLLIEKYFDSSRHIEFQIFGDKHGNALHLFERDCSVQRRYQKIIEESPSPILSPEMRKKMGDAAVNAAKAINYDNAGTVEFIYIENQTSNNGKANSPSPLERGQGGEANSLSFGEGGGEASFYFLEVNTRLQVEHPVTEMVTGLDLVQLQIETAEGKPLPFKQDDLTQTGHAVEVRLYAEDAYNNFMPAIGEVLYFAPYEEAGARFDSGIQTGSLIDIYYDPMIAKIITHGTDRSDAIRKMLHTLSKTVYLGTTTNKHFLQRVLSETDFQSGSFDTSYIATHPQLMQKQKAEGTALHALLIAATLQSWHQREAARTVLKEMPSGWRNIFYQNQQVQYEYDGETIHVEYRNTNKHDFRFMIGEDAYEVKSDNAHYPYLIATINNHRQAFCIHRNENTVFAHSDSTDTVAFKELPRFPDRTAETVKGGYKAPMPGEVVKVLVKPGDKVKSGDPLLVMLSMKMENTIEAFEDGIVEEVYVTEKGFVDADALLVKINN
jgi:acetyl/propionyl-CoA carboxylase alpha subunit